MLELGGYHSGHCMPTTDFISCLCEPSSTRVIWVGSVVRPSRSFFFMNRFFRSSYYIDDEEVIYRCF